MTEDFHKQNTLPDLHGKETRPMPLPKKIGPYKIESLLNQGGMSYLYLGLTETHQPIAVKVLLPKYLKNKDVVARFLKEAEIIEMTNHPNIVKLYGQGQWEKGLYIAMELIRGVSLRQFIQQKSLSPKRALEIVLQVAYALCHLHTHGVIHRDLKPENILITESGEIKVIDFGIAQLKDEIGKEEQPRLMGTPVYMSPEQKENPRLVSFASDIYSLGIIAYELLLGRLSHGVIHLSLLPRRLRPIIEKALEPDPKNRQHDIVDFVTEIAEALKTIDEQDLVEEEETSREWLDTSRAILLTGKKPRFPEVEIGIALHLSPFLNALYFDFFRLSENRLALLFAEPTETHSTSFLHATTFRGLFRMATLSKEISPTKILTQINQALSEDPTSQKFAFSLLVLSPEKDQLSFLSCQPMQLWHIHEGSREVRNLAVPNSPLGVDPNGSMLESADNWNEGDLLFLSTLEAPEPKIDESFLRLSAQLQAERVLQENMHAQSTSIKKSAAVLALRRI